MVPITHMAPIIYFPDTLRLLKLKLIQLKVTHDDSTSAGTKYKRYGIIFLFSECRVNKRPVRLVLFVSKG